MTEKQDDIFQAAESISAAMPPPQEPSSNGNASTDNIATPKDRLGRSFDSSIHMVGPDGLPILAPNGFIKLKPGRKTGSHTGPRSYVPRDAPASADESAATGAAIAESIFLLCRGIGGEEFIPIERDNINERAMMISAWQRYCDAKGITEVPPGMFVSIAMLNYIAPRFQYPTVRARFGGIFMGIRNKWKSWRARRRGEKQPDAPAPTKE